jgi:outer membrane protein OmpA-like peptidoglycan-associated protein
MTPASPPTVAATPPAPAVESPAPSGYAQPAAVPVNPAAPAGQVVNNQVVVTPGFFGTQPPPSPAPQQAQVAPTTQLDPLQTVISAPPPAPATAPATPPDPTIAARAEAVVQRATEPPPALPPPPPTEVTPIPNATAPGSGQAPAVAALPPGGAAGPSGGTRSEQLDEALRREFPDSGARTPTPQGVDVLAATIYFAEGSAGLSEEDRVIVREVARLHRERGGRVRVVGYASPEGRARDVMARRLANLEIAGRRADAVSRELGRFGVPGGAITSSAEEATAAVAPSGYGAAGERRVDIYLDY